MEKGRKRRGTTQENGGQIEGEGDPNGPEGQWLGEAEERKKRTVASGSLTISFSMFSVFSFMVG